MTRRPGPPKPSAAAPRRASVLGTVGFSSALLAALLAVVALGAVATMARAGTGGMIALPPPNITPKSGLRLTMDCTWVENYGYLPVQVTLTSAIPTTADQTITFRFKAGTYQFGDTPVIAVDKDIELPEGATTATATVLVPKLQDWQYVWWDTLIDGSFEQELSFPRSGMGWFNQMNSYSGDTSPRVLIVADDGQQIATSTMVIGSTIYQQQQGAQSITVQQPGVPLVFSGVASANPNMGITNFFTQRAVSNLPSMWLAYTALDYLFLTPEQLGKIQQDNPEAWEAISKWVRGGGNLWVHDLGNGWGKLPAMLSKMEGLVPSAETRGAAWHIPFTRPGSDVGTAFKREAIARQSATELTVAIPFAWRVAGMGALLVSQKPFEQLTGQEWSWLQEQGGQGLAWPSRHGTIPNLPNADFAALLIPGVGLAPVTEFRILITLFVVLIGPVNYWLLKRWKRLHLLILTVPLSALVVTMALFAYAILSDGLSTQMRVHSYTALDQRSGEATSWSRLSYYAGLAPSGGLAFSRDTAVYPINSGWSDSSFYYSGELQMTPRAMQWADKQYLTEGWLASRTPTQYLTIAARESSKGLQITPQAQGLRVRNRLGTDVELLVLRDKDGQLYMTESLDAGATATMKAVERESVVASKLRTIFSQNAPEFPEGFQDRTNGMFGRQTPTNNSYNYYYGGTPSYASSSRLEQRLASFTQPVDSQSGRSVNLEDGTYLALTTRGVDLETGLVDPHEEASFHVVEGTW